MKRHRQLLMIAVLALLLVVPATALAADASGPIGDDLWFDFDAETKTLTVSGTGELVKHFYPCRGEYTSLVVEEGIISIAEEAFANEWWLESVTLPSSVKTVGDRAFNNTGMTTLILSEGLEIIGDGAFCSLSLKDVNLPSTVTVIGKGALPYTLTTVYYPAGVTEIGNGTGELQHIYFGGDAPQINSENELEEHPFPEDAILRYPEGASGWDEGIWTMYESYPIDYETEMIPLSEYYDSGWQKVDGSWRQVVNIHGSSYALTGFQTLKGYQKGGESGSNEYLLNEDGSVFTGFKKLDGHWRFFAEKGWGPKTSTYGQMLKSQYINETSEGYISDSEKAAGRTHASYYYFFDAEGHMYTGWHKDELTRDRWMYFGESGSGPKTSRLGRRYAYGMLTCIGNNGKENKYFFFSTGPMYIGYHKTMGYFNEIGSDPRTDLLGAHITDPDVAIVSVEDQYGKRKGLVEQGGALQLTAGISPENAVDKTLRWTSSNTSVATVSSGGKITGKSPGKAVITCASTANPDAKDKYSVQVFEEYIYATKLVNGKSYDIDNDGDKEKYKFELESEPDWEGLDKARFYFDNLRAYSMDVTKDGKAEMYMVDIDPSDEYVEVFAVGDWNGHRAVYPMRLRLTYLLIDGVNTKVIMQTYFRFLGPMGHDLGSRIYCSDVKSPIRVTGTGAVEIHTGDYARTEFGDWDRYILDGEKLKAQFHRIYD